MLCNPLQAQQVLAHALDNRYAILAVNADSPAAISDCLEAALDLDAPIIIETSLWQLTGKSFGDGNAITGLLRYLADLSAVAQSERYQSIPVIYHTDHIKGPETLEILKAAIQGVDLNYDERQLRLHASTVSLDASDFSEEQNIHHLKKLASFASEAHVPVTLEMESAVDDRVTPEDETRRLLGSVEEAYPGVIHLWAPGVGTQHGFTSDDGYSGFQVETIEKNVALIEEITGRRFGIALHGSTGLNPQRLAEAARSGVTKVNWSSESLYIRSTAAKSYFEEHAAQLERSHKDWKKTAMDNGLQQFVSKKYIPKVKERMELLGGKGKASAIFENAAALDRS